MRGDLQRLDKYLPEGTSFEAFIRATTTDAEAMHEMQVERVERMRKAREDAQRAMAEHLPKESTE